MKEQDYVAALKSIIGQAEMMVADIESKTPNVVERHDKEAFADEPVIKVEYWKWLTHNLSGEKYFNAVQRHEYTFTGKPDWKRIIRETFGDGAEVVRVTPVKGEMLDHMGCEEAVEILSKYCIKHGTIQRVNSYVYPYWFTWKYITDSDIEAAIREHHKGDRPEPKFEVGQWVVCSHPNNEGGGLASINEDGGKGYGLSNGWRVAEYCLRPAVPSDFDVTVGNMKVRAYEEGGINDLVYLRWSDGSSSAVSRAVAATLGYPVCPLSVSGGKFEAPKGE